MCHEAGQRPRSLVTSVEKLATPAWRIRRVSASIIGAELSRAVTEPAGPTARAAARVVSPVPAPTSTTRHPADTPAVDNRHSLTSARDSARCFSLRSHAAAKSRSDALGLTFATWERTCLNASWTTAGSVASSDARAYPTHGLSLASVMGPGCCHEEGTTCCHD